MWNCRAQPGLLRMGYGALLLVAVSAASNARSKPPVQGAHFVDEMRRQSLTWRYMNVQ